jgi:hypothetical protein
MPCVQQPLHVVALHGAVAVHPPVMTGAHVVPAPQCLQGEPPSPHSSSAIPVKHWSWSQHPRQFKDEHGPDVLGAPLQRPPASGWAMHTPL